MRHISETLYSIQFVSNVTGINPHTIRAWEKRYGATNPRRDKNGKRLYSDNQIKHLKVLHTLVNLGNSISVIANLTKQELDLVAKKYNLLDEGYEKREKNEFNTEICINRIKTSINFFKLDILSHELEKSELYLSPINFTNWILLPLVREIRALKSEKKLNFKQREQLYLIVKSHLNRLVSGSNPNQFKTDKKVIISSPSGGLNEICAIAASIYFKEENYKVEYLGGNVEANILAQVEKHFHSSLIFTAVNYSHDSVFSWERKKTYISELNQKLGKTAKLVVGGFKNEIFPCSKLYTTITDFNDIKKL